MGRRGWKRVVFAVAIFATALSSVTAQAAELIDVNEEPVEVGSEITATSTTFETALTTAQEITCEFSTLHGIVTENNPTEQPGVVIDEIEFTTSGCLLKLTEASLTFPASITNLSLGSLAIDENEGSATASYAYDVPALGLSNCTLEGTFNFAYESGSQTLELTESPLALESGGMSCHPSGSAYGPFTLENGLGPVEIS